MGKVSLSESSRVTDAHPASPKSSSQTAASENGEGVEVGNQVLCRLLWEREGGAQGVDLGHRHCGHEREGGLPLCRRYCTDTATIRRVLSPNPDYRMKEQGAVLNWFDITEREGYYSLNDKAEDVLRSKEGQQLFAGIFADKRKGMGDGASSSDGMMKMMGGFTVLRLMNLLGTLGERPTKEELLSLNEKLNQIHRV